MADHNELGKWGEDLAADYLQRKGYTIIERDWKSGRRDLDIIAFDERVLKQKDHILRVCQTLGDWTLE